MVAWWGVRPARLQQERFEHRLILVLQETGFHFYQTGKPIIPSARLTVEAVAKLMNAADALLAKVAK